MKSLSTPPYFHNSLEDCVLVYLLSSRKRCVRPTCVMTTVHMNCVVCAGFSVRTCISKVWIHTLCEVSSVSSRSISWQKRSQHRLSFSPSTPPYFHMPLKIAFLSIFSLLERDACTQCVQWLQRIWIVLFVLGCLCERANLKSESALFARRVPWCCVYTHLALDLLRIDHTR